MKAFWRSSSVKAHPVRVEALVVEDDVDQAELLGGLLRMQGALVSWAGNVAGALEQLSGSARYELAFVDLALPNGSGVEVVRILKERCRGTHVVVVSGAPDKLLLAMAYGYVGVLTKPYSINSVREVLAKHRLPYAD